MSIIVPCYNEEKALPLFYEQLHRVLSEIDCDYEILLVDDGSGDHTLDVMRDIASRDPEVYFLSFSRNFGKESAMYAGFRNVTGDYVVVMDADMQHPPELLPDMLEILRTQDYDSVATKRQNRQGENAIRSWLSQIFYRVIGGDTEVDIEESSTDFRLMKRKMVDAIITMGECDRFSKGIFSWVGFKTRWISFPNTERVAGETKWTFRHLAKYAISGIVNFSHTPLYLVAWSGGIVVAISLILLLALLVRMATPNAPVSDVVLAACIIALICGVQLLCLGIVGQYIANIQKEIKRRPQYIIADSNIDDVKGS